MNLTAHQIIQASDISKLLSHKNSVHTSRQINHLIKKRMIEPEEPGKRKYVIRFDNNYLMRGIMSALDKAGFLPDNSIELKH